MTTFIEVALTTGELMLVWFIFNIDPIGYGLVKESKHIQEIKEIKTRINEIFMIILMRFVQQ